MAGHEINRNGDQLESQQSSSLFVIGPDSVRDDFFRQPNQSDSSGMVKLGFPHLVVAFHSKYETGAELITDAELKQAGLNPKDVKHTHKQERNGDTEENTTVKYPNGLEVSVTGRTKHLSKSDLVGKPTVEIKEPLPKGFHQDKDGTILDAHKNRVAHINEDGTVTVKVGKDYLTQSPNGVREETVVEGKDGKGMIGRVHI